MSAGTQLYKPPFIFHGDLINKVSSILKSIQLTLR